MPGRDWQCAHGLKKEEFERLCCMLFDGVTEAMMAALFKEVDRDMNGEIDFNEFITLIDSLGSHLSILQQAKPGADGDGDGGGGGGGGEEGGAEGGGGERSRATSWQRLWCVLLDR